MDINLSDLKYFIKTAEEKNISKAATELGIRQPSLSLAIKRLEGHLDSPLFIRSKKGVTLTREGKSLYAKAQEILELWTETQEQVGSLKGNLSGTLKIGCHPSVGLYSLKYFVPGFLSEHPQVNIDFIHGLSREITDAVINSEADIGLVINPISHPDLIIKKVLNDEVCFWASKKAIGKGNIEELPLICDPSLFQSQELIKSMKKNKLNFQRTIKSGNLENIVNLVNEGVGVGIIPSRVVREMGKSLEIIPRSPKFKDELCLVYRYEQKNLKIINKMTEAILENLKK